MTAPKRPAIDKAADIIQTVRDHWWPTPTPPRMELDALPPELLRRLADEKDCAAAAVDEEVDRRSDAAADRADTMVDRYDPDDRQPMAGDPWWRDEERD